MPVTLESANSSDTSGRFPGLDALRVAAACVVVMTHAVMAYLTRFPSAEMWPVHEPMGVPVADVLFLYSRGTAMQVFLVTAGFLSAHAAMRVGAESFLRRRMMRLGGPLVVGVLTLIPAMWAIWVWGAWRNGSPRMDDVVELRFDAMSAAGLVGPAHLWYLEYLLLFTILLAGWVRRVEGRAAARVWGAGGIVAGAVVVCAALAGVLMAAPNMLSDFHNVFLPSPLFFAYNAAFFFVGVVLRRHGEVLTMAARVAWPAMVVAHAAFVLWMVALFGEALPAASRPAVIALAPVVCSIGSVAGWFGLAARWKGGSPATHARLRRWAGATLTVYVAHLPFVWAAQTALYAVAIPAMVKAAIATLAGLGGGLAVLWVMNVARAKWRERRGARADASLEPSGPGVATSADLVG